jgi:NADP-dependent aldehyde dehydrogenase
MEVAPVLLDGRWQDADAADTFTVARPESGEPLPTRFPVSRWPDLDRALAAAERAARELEAVTPTTLATFLEGYARLLDTHASELAEIAHLETALPLRPRLLEQELPRTSLQLRLSAQAAREGSWALPTIDVRHDIRSMHVPIGPVVVFGPSNFPFAYNGVCGTDFAAAIAAGNPVIAKAHPLHPETTRRLAVLAAEAVVASRLPPAMVQLLYAMSSEDGKRLVSDPRVGAAGFTGSRAGGLSLKAAADAAGKPIYLEMSSINPVVLLPAALRSRGAAIAEAFVASATAAAGQFCTNPGLVLLIDDDASRAWTNDVAGRFETTTPATMLSRQGAESLHAAIGQLVQSGAEVLVGHAPFEGDRAAYRPTLLRAGGGRFIATPTLQREAFGTSTLVVACGDEAELLAAVASLEGNLTGSIYADADDAAIEAGVLRSLRRKVGRVLHGHMPTGVAVSAAMQHGGPFPATGHPGFTAVGPPATLRRFSRLQCLDRVPQRLLPPPLRDANPSHAWRLIDGQWTQRDVHPAGTQPAS